MAIDTAVRHPGNLNGHFLMSRQLWRCIHFNISQLGSSDVDFEVLHSHKTGITIWTSQNSHVFQEIVKKRDEEKHCTFLYTLLLII
jgi:hypothetical protein